MPQQDITCDEAICAWIGMLLKAAQKRGANIVRVKESQIETACRAWCRSRYGVTYTPASFSRRWREIRDERRHLTTFPQYGLGRILNGPKDGPQHTWFIYAKTE